MTIQQHKSTTSYMFINFSLIARRPFVITFFLVVQNAGTRTQRFSKHNHTTHIGQHARCMCVCFENEKPYRYSYSKPQDDKQCHRFVSFVRSRCGYSSRRLPSGRERDHDVERLNDFKRNRLLSRTEKCFMLISRSGNEPRSCFDSGSCYFWPSHRKTDTGVV